MTDLSNPIFHDVTKAREHLEAVRWPDGPFCPHCGDTEHARKLRGKSHRPGLYQCNGCRGHFTVTVGTLYERSKVPLHKWLMATHLLCASKKGMSSHQLHRMLGVTYKTAWFMTHRIRESMRETDPEPMGGDGKTVEVDETFWGKAPSVFISGLGWQQRKGWHYKQKILTLVERGGRARSFHIAEVNSATIRPILKTQLYPDTHMMTDEAMHYRKVGKEFRKHEAVHHTIGEYVRGDVHTNCIEGYFSILKRGLTGVYQHVGQQHLKRYVCEFDFRYSTRGVTDSERTEEALKGIWGKRLTYRRISPRPAT